MCNNSKLLKQLEVAETTVHRLVGKDLKKRGLEMMKQACVRGQSTAEWLGPGKQVGVDSQSRSNMSNRHMAPPTTHISIFILTGTSDGG